MTKKYIYKKKIYAYIFFYALRRVLLAGALE